MVIRVGSAVDTLLFRGYLNDLHASELQELYGKINKNHFISFFQNEEFYVCIYAQRDCDTILFHHEGGVEIGDVDSKVKYYQRR